MRNENEKSFAGELEFNERLFFRKEQKKKEINQESGRIHIPYTDRPSKIPFQLLFIYIIVYTIKVNIMEKNIFQLDNEQLKEIARSFKAKVEEGLNTENAEIQCIPTFITPKASSINGKSLVLDLGRNQLSGGNR